MLGDTKEWMQCLGHHYFCEFLTIRSESTTCLCIFRSSQCSLTIKLQLVQALSECWLRAMTVNQHNPCPCHCTVNSNTHKIAQSAYLETVRCEVMSCSKSVSQCSHVQPCRNGLVQMSLFRSYTLFWFIGSIRMKSTCSATVAVSLRC